MKILRIYSLSNFHICHTSVLAKVIMLYITPLWLIYTNWKFVSFDHFSLIPPLLKSAIYNISCHIDFQHLMDEYWYENVYTMYYAKYNKIVCKILTYFLIYVPIIYYQGW